MTIRRMLDGMLDERRGPHAALLGALFTAFLLLPCAPLGSRQADGAAVEGAPRLPVVSSSASDEALRDGGSPAWGGITPTPISLQRTPPLYEGDPLDDGVRPDASVSLARSSDRLLVRLAWEDSTEDKLPDPERYLDAGEAGIYKQHSRDIERFADGACLMLPRRQGPREAFPSLVMGEPGETVDLYYWNKSRGFEHLQAAGRGTTGPTGSALSGTVSRTPHGWVVVFEIPAPASGTPCAFAVWDGAQGQRDGLKFFSIWYEMIQEGGS